MAEQPVGDKVRDKLRDVGVHVEKRPAGAVPQILGSLVGSIAGQAMASVFRMGPLGHLAGMLGGALAGHAAVTNRVYLDPNEGGAKPESPAKYSDRR